MRISKTLFKQFGRCSKYAYLYDLYIKKSQSNAFLFNEDDKITKVLELISQMYDAETGEDLINTINEKVEVMLPIYNAVEQMAIKKAEEKFGGKIIHSTETKEQKKASVLDGDNELYCYLDGFQENAQEINVFEVKATTSKKFYELGVKKNKKFNSIFDDCDGIYKLKNDYLDSEYQKAYQKFYDRYGDVGKYVFDLAVECYIIEHSKDYDSNKKYNYYLVVLNHQYVYDGQAEGKNKVYSKNTNGNDLYIFIELTEVVKNYSKQIFDIYEKIKQSIDTKTIIECGIGRYCEKKSSNKCPFVNICWQKVSGKGNITEYLNNHLGFGVDKTNKASVFELINGGKYYIDSIPEDWLNSSNNKIQRSCYENNTEFVDVDKIKKGIECIKYPIYYLDFESFPSPLPRFIWETPYTQSVFQFSLHIEKSPKSCNKEKDHYEFLARNNNEDCREDMIKDLIRYIDLQNGGTVIVYNKSFEHTRIKELSKIFPQYKSKLDDINKHMFDLLDIVKGSKSLYESLGYNEELAKQINYYNNDLRGSYSIKKVLPIFSDLSYKDMSIANGNEAIVAYAKFDKLDDEELKQLRIDLLKYCQQDTWAMVVIFWGLLDRIK